MSNARPLTPYQQIERQKELANRIEPLATEYWQTGDALCHTLQQLVNADILDTYCFWETCSLAGCALQNAGCTDLLERSLSADTDFSSDSMRALWAIMEMLDAAIKTDFRRFKDAHSNITGDSSAMQHFERRLFEITQRAMVESYGQVLKTFYIRVVILVEEFGEFLLSLQRHPFSQHLSKDAQEAVNHWEDYRTTNHVGWGAHGRRYGFPVPKRKSLPSNDSLGSDIPKGTDGQQKQTEVVKVNRMTSEETVSKFVNWIPKDATQLFLWCIKAIDIVRNYPADIPVAYLQTISETCYRLALLYAPSDILDELRPKEFGSQFQRQTQFHIEGVGNGYSALLGRLQVLTAITRDARTSTSVEIHEPIAIPTTRCVLTKTQREDAISKAILACTGDANKTIKQARIEALTVKTLSAMTRIPSSTIGDSDTWTTFETGRKGNKIAVPKSPRTRALHRRTIETRADERTETPLTHAVRNELEANFRRVGSAEEVAKFDELTFEEQNELLELSKDFFDRTNE